MTAMKAMQGMKAMTTKANDCVEGPAPKSMKANDCPNKDGTARWGEAWRHIGTRGFGQIQDQAYVEPHAQEVTIVPWYPTPNPKD